MIYIYMVWRILNDQLNIACKWVESAKNVVFFLHSQILFPYLQC